MGGPLVSVVVPTCNRAQTIVRAVESILQQTYRPLELIVVDDGSTDGTSEVLRPYRNSLVYVFQDNAGASAARNRGIRESKGDFVAFLDSDDMWLPTKLQRQVDLLRRAGPEVPCCLCDTLLRWPNKPEQSAFQVAWLKLNEPQGLWLNPATVLATRFVLFCQAVLVRREFLLDCGGFDERLWVMEDHDLALRLAVRGPWAFIRDPLAVWCGANDDFNLSVAARKQPLRLYRCMEQIDQKILEQQPPPEARTRRCLERHLRWVRRHLLAQQWADSGRVLSRLGARSMMGWMRLQQAWFRRSWYFPQARTTSIPGPAPAED